MSDLLSVIGIILNLTGGLFIARGLFISKAEAIEISVARWGGNDGTNATLPAVKDKMKQRKWAVWGAFFLILGSALQLISLVV